MKRNNIARFLFLVLILAWAGTEMWPLKDESGKLIEQFGKATNKDAAFEQAYDEAKAAHDPDDENSNEFGILQSAVENAGLVLSNYTWSPKLTFRGQLPDNRVVLQKLQKKVAGKLQLGLDLKGGSSFLVALDTSNLNTNDLDKASATKVALDQAVEVLRARVDTIGVAEPEIRTMGEDKIMVQLPGLSEANRAKAKKLVTEAAFLEFALVHNDSERLIANGIIPDGYKQYSHATKDRDGQERPEELLIQVDKDQPNKAWNQYGLKGEHISKASPSRNPLTQEPMILFTFNSEGAKAMGQLSGGNIGERMAIILDGNLMSAPVLQERITSNGQITGSFTSEEAATIANALLNPLKAPLTIEEEMSVEPSLGKDSVQSGQNAALWGVIAVAVFMLLYYWFSGLVANFALVLNLFILIGVLCYLGAALTLPGIAGIVLTIGMAIDANVLIFERIREELEAGKGEQGAVETGYAKAFGTIIDANLTTLIVSVILITMGTGPVKGFGVTLTVGICASMFTALVVTRLVFDLFRNFGAGKSLGSLIFAKKPKLNFMGFAKYAFVASWILVAIGIGTGINRGSDAMGVDFKGGDQITFEFTEGQEKDVGQLRDALGQAGIEGAMIQYQAGGGSRERLQVTVGFGSGETAKVALEEAFAGDEGFKEVSRLGTGPSISNEILQGATKSLLIAMFAILVYVTFRYEFSFALGAILAICHDVLMTLGIFYIWGGELSAPVMAAVLTIIGFSINDTIVIFDRIREDLKLGLPGTFTEIMNGAISKTMSRTIITSGTTLLAAGSLFLFGGGAIHAFAFTLLAGVLTGTFSSIFIAGWFVLWKNKGEKPKLADETVITQHSISTSEA